MQLITIYTVQCSVNFMQMRFFFLLSNRKWTFRKNIIIIYFCIVMYVVWLREISDFMYLGCPSERSNRKSAPALLATPSRPGPTGPLPGREIARARFGCCLCHRTSLLSKAATTTLFYLGHHSTPSGPSPPPLPLVGKWGKQCDKVVVVYKSAVGRGHHSYSVSDSTCPIRNFRKPPALRGIEIVMRSLIYVLKSDEESWHS